MLFEQERLLLIRKIILADTMEEKEAFIAQLLPLHKQDFKDIFLN
jgi:pyruvate,orthophosphate dikinase